MASRWFLTRKNFIITTISVAIQADGCYAGSFAGGQVARFVEQIYTVEGTYDGYRVVTAVPGVDLSVNPVRTYPNDEMAFHTLGYLRRDDDPGSGSEMPVHFRYRLPDYIGVDGLEGVYDTLLRGEAGAKSIRVNNISYRTSEEVWAWPESGYDIALSLDRDIQLAAEAALQANGPETRGAVVVMEPHTGDLLALVSLPGFDSNKFISGFSREEITRLNDETTQPLAQPCYRQRWRGVPARLHFQTHFLRGLSSRRDCSIPKKKYTIRVFSGIKASIPIIHWMILRHRAITISSRRSRDRATPISFTMR